MFNQTLRITQNPRSKQNQRLEPSLRLAIKPAALLAAVFSVGLLSGCVSSAYQSPTQLQGEQLVIALPSQYQSVSAPALWWQQLQDQQLNQLLARALAQNASLQAASANIERFQALAANQTDEQWPKATAGIRGQRSQQGQHGPVDSQYQQGLNLTWQIDLSGELALAAQAAAKDQQIATLQWRALQLELLSAVAQSYGQWQHSMARLALAQRSLQNLQQSRQIVAARQQAGTASALEVERLQVQQLAVQSSLPLFKLAAEQARSQLGALVGAPDLQLTESVLPELGQPLALSAFADALRWRPDLAISELQLAKSWDQHAMAKAALYPKLSVSGFLGFISAGSLSADSLSQSWQLTPSLQLPSTDLWSGIDLLAAADANRTVALAQYRQQVLDVISQMQQALAAYQQQRQYQLLKTQQLSSSEQALAITRSQYQAGLVDFLALLDAEREVLQLRDEASAAGQQHFASLVQVFQRFGAGVSVGSPAAPVAATMIEPAAVSLQVASPAADSHGS